LTNCLLDLIGYTSAVWVLGCFAKRITGFDWFFVEKSHFPHPWLAAPYAAMFFLVHMIVVMALCPCQEHCCVIVLEVFP
jgi:hypothetical protein